MRYYRAAYGGKGARKMSGRFNRPGESAVYVSLDVFTAYAEFQRELIGNPQPCVLIAAHVTVRGLLDLTGDLSSCEPDLQAWRCDWEAARDAFSMDSASDCASWRCKDIAVAAHRSGIIYPSTMNPGGVDLALFIEDATVGHCLILPIDDFDAVAAAALGVP
jgi:RES domain-containing protein